MLKIISSLALLTGILFLDAVITRDLWWWFVTGTFGIKALTLAQACGLSLLAAFATLRARRSDTTVEDLGTAILAMFWIWGLGYTVYHVWCV